MTCCFEWGDVIAQLKHCYYRAGGFILNWIIISHAKGKRGIVNFNTYEYKKCIVVLAKNEDAALIRYSILVRVAEEQYSSINAISEYLHIKPIRHVQIRLHSRATTIGGNYLIAGALADWKRRRIDLIVHQRIDEDSEVLGLHEMVHIIIGIAWGDSRSKFFSEGIANAIDGMYQGETIERIYLRHMENNQLLSMDELLINTTAERYDLFYPQSGVIVKYIITNFGLRMVEKMYKYTRKKVMSRRRIESMLSCSSNELLRRISVALLSEPVTDFV